MPWRSVRTVLPAIFISLMLKNLSCSSGPPLSFSITFQACGPWIWKRHEMRLTGLPIGRDGEADRLMISTS